MSAEVSAVTGVSQAAGTVVFQPPECAFGPYLVQSDLYGAALVIYRALTGTYPFAHLFEADPPAGVRDSQPAIPSRFGEFFFGYFFAPSSLPFGKLNATFV